MNEFIRVAMLGISAAILAVLIVISVEVSAAPISTDNRGPRLILSEFESAARDLSVQRGSDERHFIVQFPNSTSRDAQGWFIAHLEGLGESSTRDRSERIRIDLVGVRRQWRTMNPVYTYESNLSDLETFEIRRVERPHPPVQSPEGSLIPDTRSQKWHYVTDCRWNEKTNTLTIEHEFPGNAWIAMRPPYTPAYHNNFMAWVQRQRNARVHEIGTSREGHPLHIVQIGGFNDADARRNACIVMYAREHADEHDSSWPVVGAIRFLLGPTREAAALRSRATFLFVPLIDPDGAAQSLYNHITYGYDPNPDQSVREARVFAGFFQEWVNEGKRLDIVLNLHNVESAEGPALFIPRYETGRQQYCAVLDRLIADRVRAFDIRARPGTGRHSLRTFRLQGFLARYTGSLGMLYEVNSQDPEHHLTLEQLQMIGVGMVQGAVQYVYSREAAPLIAEINQHRRVRSQNWKRYEPVDDELARDGPVRREHLYDTMPDWERFNLSHGIFPRLLRQLYAAGRQPLKD